MTKGKSGSAARRGFEEGIPCEEPCVISFPKRLALASAG